jgi:hypothetical protein
MLFKNQSIYIPIIKYNAQRREYILQPEVQERLLRGGDLRLNQMRLSVILRRAGPTGIAAQW